MQCKNGNVLGDETLYRKGSVEDPISPAELEEKFRNLAVPVMGKAKADACIERIQTLENEAKVGNPLDL